GRPRAPGQATISAAGMRAAQGRGRAEADAAAEPTRGVGHAVTIEYTVRTAKDEPEGAIVLFHGRGTGEYDLQPLLEVLDPERRFLGVTPRGPISLPPGGAHWYVVREIGYPDRETFLGSYALAGAWL